MRPVLTAISLAAFAWLLAPVAAAQAATYSVWACANGAGKPLSAGDWTAGGAATTTCGSASAGGTAGNLQAISGAGPSQPNASVASQWSVAAAPDTKISALDVWWKNDAGLEFPGRIQVYAGARSVYQRDSGTFGSTTLPFDEANRQAFSGLNEDSATLVAWCLFTCAQPDRKISAFYQAFRTKVTVSDDVAPAGEASGTTDSMTLAAPVTLQARASDKGGGVRDLQLVINGAVVDTKTAGGSCNDIDTTTGDDKDYAVMKPCPAQLPAAEQPPATWQLTPAMLGPGAAHTVAIVAHDAAGTAGTLLSHRVLVAPALQDGAPPPDRFDAARNLFFNPDADVTSAGRPNGLNAGPARFDLAFVITRKVRRKGRVRTVKRLTGRRTVSYSRAARMRARLTTPTGQPIISARVYRAQSVAGGPWRLSTTPLVTSKTGRVSVLMPARSPSRRVQLVYFPLTSSNLSIRSPARLLRVRAPVSLRVNRRTMQAGGRVTIRARVRAGMRPGATVIGAVQLRDRGRWRTIRQLRFTPRSKGSVRTALRLNTRGTYRLRVRVSGQAGLRYTTGSSPARTVRVR